MSKPPHVQPVHRRAITKERALQILNDVSERFWEDGDTSFATKVELLQTICWLRDEELRERQRKDMALDEIARVALKARLYHHS